MAAALNDLGDTYRSLERNPEADPCSLKALEMRTKLAGPGDAATAQSTVDLGKFYWQTQQFQKANEYLEKGFALQQAALGAEHPDLIETLDYWGDLYAYIGQNKKGEALLDRARELCEKTLGKQHARYADLLNDLRRKSIR